MIMTSNLTVANQWLHVLATGSGRGVLLCSLLVKISCMLVTSELKYLGVHVIAARYLKVSVEHLRSKFLSYI